jgi:aryl-alcohol dehydrogenase-like predicted oxidoreductase
MTWGEHGEPRFPMRYRTLGPKGPTVSEISFGTGDNAGLMVLGNERERFAAVDRALELGVNYFDTSPDYGKGVAETNLGQALRSRRGAALIATKVEIMPETLDDIEATVTRSLDESLRRLGMDAVDVYMIHNPPRLARDPTIRVWTPLTYDDFLGPALRGLERARAAGKARYFGFACEYAHAVAVKPLLETGFFTVINARYSLVNPTGGMEMPAGIAFGPDYENYDGMLTHAAAHGVGVAVIRPLAGGGLSSQVAHAGLSGRHAMAGGGFTTNPERLRPEYERGRNFTFLEDGTRTLQQAAFIFNLMNPAVSTVIGGYSELAHLEELATTSGAPPLTDDELERIRAVYARNFGLPV